MSEARFRLLYSSLYLPLMALDKVRAQASWVVRDPESLREGGRTPDHLRLFYPVLFKERFFQNDVVTNEKTAWFGRRITYVGIWTIAVQTCILDGVRTLYS